MVENWGQQQEAASFDVVADVWMVQSIEMYWYWRIRKEMDEQVDVIAQLRKLNIDGEDEFLLAVFRRLKPRSQRRLKDEASKEDPDEDFVEIVEVAAQAQKAEDKAQKEEVEKRKVEDKLQKEEVEKRKVEDKLQEVEVEKQKVEDKLQKVEESIYEYYSEGLPGLGIQLAASASSTKKSDKGRGHESISPSECEFEVCEFDAEWEALVRMKCVFNRDLLRADRTDAVLTWANAATLREYVRDILRHVLSTLRLPEQLDVVAEMDFDKHHRPDVAVIRWNNVPICVVEVKKPDIKPDHDAAARRAFFEDDAAAKQLMDYMVRAQAASGLDHMFGVLTDFVHWRPFWLPGAEAAAASSQRPDVTGRAGEGPEVGVPAELRSLLGRASVAVEADAEQPVTAELFAGETLTAFRLLDREGTRVGTQRVVRMLASVILKAFTSPRQLPVLSQRRLYRELAPDHMGFKTLAAGLEFRPAMPNATAQRFTLLAPLGRGRDGEVHWVCTEAGLCAALKLLVFSRDEGKKDVLARARREAEYWRKLWGAKSAREVDFSDRVGILMPLVRQLTETEVRSRMNEVEDALRTLARKGVVHQDVRIRHVAEWNGKVILIDLSSMEDGVGEDDAFNRMHTSLNEGE